MLLYNSPSGLVIYWIMNQIFSLGKNIYYIKKGKTKGLVPVIGALIIIILVSIGTALLRIDTTRDVFVAECLLAVSITVIVIRILKEYHVKKPAIIRKILSFFESGGAKKLLFPVVLTGFCMALLLGVYIPTTVLSSSVGEFVNRATHQFQSELFFYPATVYLGFFVIWMPVIIYSQEGYIRRNLAGIIWGIFGIAMINQFLFDPHVGVLYSDLVFDGELRFGTCRIIGNILVCLAGGCVFLIIFIRKLEWMKRMAGIFIIALVFLSAKNVVDINNYISGTRSKTAKEQTSTLNFSKNGKNVVDINNYISGTRSKTAKEQTSTLNFSKNGKNVVVLMLDRAIGGYIPYIFEEKPQLKESFSGFVYYPNTVSFGKYTNFGTPGLFGGYEYTPSEIDRRSDELLKDKQNEALKVLPVLFLENGYDVTVSDPPLASYEYTPDLSIYDDYPDIHAYNLTGKFTSKFNHLVEGSITERQKHNFLMYSLFRTVPLFVKPYVYEGGNYISINNNLQLTGVFIDAYSTLSEYPTITAAQDNDQDYFMMLQNAMTHEPVPLSPPDYKVSTEGSGFWQRPEYHDLIYDGHTMTIDSDWEWDHYCVNMAAYLLVGKWLDYLKEIGVYDNTRIIIVADHGRGLEQFKDLIHPDGLDIESVWPVLMLKDFGSNKPFSVSDEFMTNADVPTLATRGIIENPVNPFSGNEIANEKKLEGTIVITDSDKWATDSKAKTFDTSDGHWWSVHDSIFDMNNWARLD